MATRTQPLIRSTASRDDTQIRLGPLIDLIQAARRPGERAKEARSLVEFGQASGALPADIPQREAEREFGERVLSDFFARTAARKPQPTGTEAAPAPSGFLDTLSKIGRGATEPPPAAPEFDPSEPRSFFEALDVAAQGLPSAKPQTPEEVIRLEQAGRGSEESLQALRDLLTQRGGALATAAAREPAAPKGFEFSQEMQDLFLGAGITSPEQITPEIAQLGQQYQVLSPEVQQRLSSEGVNFLTTTPATRSGAVLFDQINEPTVQDVLLRGGVPLSETTPRAVNAATAQARGEALDIAAENIRTEAEIKAGVKLAFTEKQADAEWNAKKRQFLSTGDLKALVNPLTGEHPVMGTTFEQAAEQGFIPITAFKLNLSVASKQMMGILDEAEGLVKKVGLSKSALTRPVRTLALYFDKASQRRPEVAEMVSFINGTVAPIIRALGEKGALAEGDVKRAIELMPKLSDTEEVALNKLGRIRSIMEGDSETGYVSSGNDLERLGITGDNLNRFKVADSVLADGIVSGLEGL
jgi:hypothetical protein